jgi:hypothetical protein
MKGNQIKYCRLKTKMIKQNENDILIGKSGSISKVYPVFGGFLQKNGLFLISS